MNEHTSGDRVLKRYDIKDAIRDVLVYVGGGYTEPKALHMIADQYGMEYYDLKDAYRMHIEMMQELKSDQEEEKLMRAELEQSRNENQAESYDMIKIYKKLGLSSNIISEMIAINEKELISYLME